MPGFRKWKLLVLWSLAAIIISTSAHAQTDLSGLWTGQSSGNRVRLEMRNGGFAQLLAGEQRSGQMSGEHFFRDSGSGFYFYTRPDGLKVKVQLLGPDRIRVTNPDGWTDVFTRPPRAVQRISPAPVAPRAVNSPQKLPPARPAKLAAWSPKAMSTTDGALRTLVISPQFAAERADALASCLPSLQQFQKTFPINTTQTTNLFFEATLDDKNMQSSSTEIMKYISNVDKNIAAGNSTVASALPAYRCLLQRRLAQLEGSPLAPGAVDGTLTPLSIGGQTPPWKQQGKDARIIASDGKSAMHCVKLVELTKTDSKMGGGGRVLSNQCSGPVEITWCYSPGDCDPGRVGNSWTVGAGRSWPVSAEQNIRWAACHGANTAAFVKDSQGLRYYCSAPLGKPRK